MDFLRPENLLQFGYKDCLLCEVERKGEEKRCIRCVGRMDQRDRLLWEINRGRIRRNAARMSLAYPGAGHFYSGRYLTGVFWASLLPLTAVLGQGTWRGPTTGHLFLLCAFGLIWYLAWLDAGRGAGEPVAPCRKACPADIDVPDYIALVREGRPLEALALVHDKLPLAAFCGRGGARPGGVSAADRLARLGCVVTVFDEAEEPGGMMRYAVPEFRFPGEALRSDGGTILARGVGFRGGMKFGRELCFESLATEGFEAVLLGVGAGVAVRVSAARGGGGGGVWRPGVSL